MKVHCVHERCRRNVFLPVLCLTRYGILSLLVLAVAPFANCRYLPRGVGKSSYLGMFWDPPQLIDWLELWYIQDFRDNGTRLIQLRDLIASCPLGWVEGDMLPSRCNCPLLLTSSRGQIWMPNSSLKLSQFGKSFCRNGPRGSVRVWSRLPWPCSL